jgi:cell division protein ZapE
MYGEVGRGKSMLMDLFYDSMKDKGAQRIHFHVFLRNVHEDIHAWRQNPKKQGDDPIPYLAAKYAADAHILCLDELEIRDIADAMIVGRLFESLLNHGVVVITTSNRIPDDLYKDGLQREKFLPFIALLKERLDIHELASIKDYRLGRVQGQQNYLDSTQPDTAQRVDQFFKDLAQGMAAQPDTLIVHGRRVAIPLAANGVARFTFADVCEQPLAAADFIEIATQYHSVVLTDIPILGPKNRDAARRFVMLIDALYEHKVFMVFTAAAAPEVLYPEGDGAFEFQRTVSRLMEMQSEAYMALEHLT